MLKWDDKYRIGVELIDIQHEFFLKAMRNYQHKFESGIFNQDLFDEMIAFIDQFSEEHFKMEEGCLVGASHCPFVRRNKVEHRIFKRHFKRFQKKVFQTRYNPALVQEVFSLVRSWVEHHLTQTDVNLKDSFLKEES